MGRKRAAGKECAGEQAEREAEHEHPRGDDAEVFEQRPVRLGGLADLQPVPVAEFRGGDEPRPAAHAGGQPRPFLRRGAESIEGGWIERRRACRLANEKPRARRPGDTDEKRLAPAVRSLGETLAQARESAVLIPRAIEIELARG